VLPRLSSDLLDLLVGAADGSLGDPPVFAPDAAVTVVCATEGYPQSPRVGDRIEGLDEARAIDGVAVYAAGVSAAPDGGLLTAGGRVLDVTATGPSLAVARERAYAAVAQIDWPGMQYRSDIAKRASAEEGQQG
jgi:phosphoribosylamine--glycine ligase